VQVRDVPENVVALLKRETSRNGLSLQKYLHDLLATRANMINNHELFDQAGAGLPEPDGDEAVKIIQWGREERDRKFGARQ